MSAATVVGFDGVHAVSWRSAHEELVRLSAKRAGLDFEECRWLLRAFRSGAHVELGYGSFYEYIERLFGYGPRLTQEKLRVAEALEALPETAEELKAGTLSFSAVRELTRVAIPETEREWLAAARGRTVREVEHLVSGHRAGSRPCDVPDASAKRHVLRFEVSGEALATFNGSHFFPRRRHALRTRTIAGHRRATSEGPPGADAYGLSRVRGEASARPCSPYSQRYPRTDHSPDAPRARPRSVLTRIARAARPRFGQRRARPCV